MFRRFAGMFRRSAGMFRKSAGMFRRSAGMFRKPAGMFRRFAGMPHLDQALDCLYVGLRVGIFAVAVKWWLLAMIEINANKTRTPCVLD